ncbi:hypothetical protein BST81_15140 [Leptolyngbya sp. 'hensonii']|uniref:hypothetical protein n=1 Tax=Leptolyngbya sp. 'hensonii' TaxID=1922337 RepID=UPI00094FB595|nr:hypothetical protein [Leptolyngbya sp. 'hensonii']OLP17655.1 hypothetical protein BST81_15140 [Leptolyngbya sp. 'hensonii']
MAMSGDYASGGDFDAPAYPSLFGITLTPIVIGSLVAILGMGGAIFMYINYVQPLSEQKNILQAEVADLQGKADAAQANQKKIKEAQVSLEKAKQKRTDVYSLFADEKSLNTLLLDINREFTRPGREVRFQSFTPAGPPALVTDDTLGPGVKGKLKTQSFGVVMEGNFAQTQALIRSIERLQPLVIIRNFNAARDSVNQKLIIKPPAVATSVGEAKLKTTFTLQVVVTPSEGQAAPPSPAPAK